MNLLTPPDKLGGLSKFVKINVKVEGLGKAEVTEAKGAITFIVDPLPVHETPDAVYVPATVVYVKPHGTVAGRVYYEFNIMYFLEYSYEIRVLIGW